MQNVVLLMDSNSNTFDITLKAVNMYLNRIFIDEEAAFESTGVHFFKGSRELHEERVLMKKGLKIVDQNKSDDLKMHFLCAIYHQGRPYFWEDRWEEEDELRSFILKEMETHKIQKAMVTLLYMRNNNLITKENMESLIDGRQSVNDDLESFFEKLRLGEKQTEFVQTYFVPKLTAKELELVEKKDSNYFKNFFWSNPDVDEIQMKMSESDSKYVQAFGRRRTFIVENVILEENLSEADYSCKFS